MAVDEPWVVIPTAGRDTLLGAVDSTWVPRERTVIVCTRPDVDVPVGCHTITDLGEINIHRWWNAGLDYAAERAARYVLVLNDDVVLAPDATDRLFHAVVATGATIATPGVDDRVTTGGSRYANRTINGACWLLDLTHGLRPDEGYRWWFGDDDLDWRARQAHGVVSVTCQMRHLHANQATEASDELKALADADGRRWRSTEG